MNKSKVIKIIHVCAIFLLIIISILIVIGVISSSYSSTMFLGTLCIFTFSKYFELRDSNEYEKIKLYKRGAYFFGLSTVISLILITGINSIMNF